MIIALYRNLQQTSDSLFSATDWRFSRPLLPQPGEPIRATKSHLPLTGSSQPGGGRCHETSDKKEWRRAQEHHGGGTRPPVAFRECARLHCQTHTGLVHGAGCEAKHQDGGELYEDEVLLGHGEKIKGRIRSTTDESITLDLKNRMEALTLQKSAVRKVSAHRPFWKRPAGWLTLVGVSTFTAIFGSHNDVDLSPAWWLLFIGPPTLLGFISSPKERIYEVPPQHRNSSWSTGSSAIKAKELNHSK